ENRWFQQFGPVQQPLGVLGPDAATSWIYSDRDFRKGGVYTEREHGFVVDKTLIDGLEIDGQLLHTFDEVNGDLVSRGVLLRDVDGDGICELIVANEKQNAVFRR